MKAVAFDLETTNLSGIMGIVLCGSFLEIVPPGYYSNHRNVGPSPRTLCIERGERNRFDPNPDKVLCTEIRDRLESYNMVVGWNSKLFDIPFLNARLAFHNERPFKPQFSLDLMYYAGGVSTRIGSRKLVNVEKFLKLSESTDGGKTDIDWDTWKAAGLGDPAAMKEVKKHCEQDVKVLGAAYWRLLPFVANLHR